ncbi:MAG: putative zinc finger/helix-turn-helix protein, YgiT family [Candidatus Accumulibacter phosphatis]|uniref:Putative zinc finger/helix-turn-helix protein, YgiT family n=1 Tax=Candidatus Accumulibacter phosphatis TaxID=327160 RepID=A0A084Y6K2_9PROT|nr:MAG: putative zinc finger/helix-turn-helix protein, YgiT family [Candidatus Accumulibacter phosphatis]
MIPPMAITTIAELVRAARNGRSQKEFAHELGVLQSSISRYESGKASPPAPVIEHCMRMVHSGSSEPIPTADELANKVRTALADTSLGQVRLLISKLIDTLTGEYAQACATTAASTVKDRK